MSVNVLLDLVGKGAEFLQVTAVRATLASMAEHAEALLKLATWSVFVLQGIEASSVKTT